MPVALNIAQLSALAAVFLSVVGVGVALLQSRLDRVRTSFAHAVTVVVGLDDDGRSMLSAIAGTLDRRTVLVVVTSDPDRPCVREARSMGARALRADLTQPESLAALPIWRRLDKLYLLSPDAAVVVVDSHPAGVDTSLGTRLAARFTSTPIYAWDPNAEVAEDRPAVVGQLRTFRLTMDVPRGHAQDRWERAAQLIHDRYAAQSDRVTPATRPWAELDEFYRGSNRRQVQRPATA